MKRIASLLCLLGLAFTGLAATPSPDKLLPADTLGVFTIPEYAKSKVTWGAWPTTRLWDDPAMKPFKDKFLGKLQSDLIAPLEREFGIKLADYQGLAQGQVTLAITANGWEGKPKQTPGFLLLVDTRDKSDALKNNLATLKKKWVDSGKQIKTDKIRDIEFTTLIFSSDDLSKTIEKAFPDPNAGNENLDPPKQKKPAQQLEWLIGQSESLFILGSSAKDIEKILIRQSGGAVPSLSEQGSFASSYNADFRDSLGYGWINLKTIVGIVLKEAGKAGADGDEAGPGGMSIPKILSAVGLAGLQTLAFNVRDTSDGCLVNLHLKVPESERKGLFKILSADAKESNPPPFVPADAVKFMRWRLDLQRAVATIEKMLTDVSPQFAGFFKLIVDNAGKDKDPDFDLRKNLIANLGDDIISFEKTPRQQTLAGLQSPPSLTLISSPKAEQLASAVKALGSLQQKPAKVKEREFLGRKVYSMSLPAQPAPGGGKPVARSLHYAASGGYVALSTDEAMLEEFLRGNTAKSLRDTPGLAEAAQKIGGMNTGLFGYENQAETTRAALEILKKESGTLANLFAGSPLAGRLGMDEGDKKFKEWVDFSILPSFDKLAKYFSFNVWGGSVNGDGITIKVFAPTPPQMKK